MKTGQVAVFVLICAIGIGIGGHLAGHIFFGVITLIGLIALTENIPLIKWFVYKTNNVIDVALFVLAGIATVKLGVTITAALTVAGLGYTMIYAPYVRKQISKRKNRLAENEKINNKLNKRNINY
jgi:Ca2+/Na+ antiporter